MPIYPLVHKDANTVPFHRRKDVLATASSKEKLDFIQSMPNGATAGINYKESDFAEQVKKVGFFATLS